jgi:hypothetical protein
MLRRFRIWASFQFWLLMMASASIAQHAQRGYILNIDGDKCWYSQEMKNERYFHTLEANTRTLVFDDPTCMVAGGIDGDINRMMIGNIITRPYAQSDARFMTRPGEFRSSSALQTRGYCIQSAQYPNIGVVVDFIVDAGHIVSVKHAIAVQGCAG